MLNASKHKSHDSTVHSCYFRINCMVSHESTLYNVKLKIIKSKKYIM